MNVTLPSALETFVRRKVETGDFDNASEVISESVRQMQLRDEAWASEAARKIEEGLADAEAGRLLTMEQVKEAMEQKKRAFHARSKGA